MALLLSVQKQKNKYAKIQKGSAKGANQVVATLTIDDIRKMSLRAMAELADNPQDRYYENLKRIWQLCDKAVTERMEEDEIVKKHNGGN